MKCARCPQNPPHKCDREGFDCTGGTLDLSEYNEETEKKWHRISMQMLNEVGNSMTRLEELIEFCKRMEYKSLGVAFCIGLKSEAEALVRILEQHFKVDSVCCKVCGQNKKDFGVGNINPNRFEAMCNPIAQAKLLNKSKTDLNIEVGLCLGHDLLFQKYSDAPTTVFAVKDRVLAHNPLGVLYSGFYKGKFRVKK